MDERRRETVYFEQPNAVFEEWLTELYNTAVNKGSSQQFTYKKALTSLQKFPLPLASGKELLVLENFGPTLCQYIDWKLKKQKNSLTTGGSGMDLPNPQDFLTSSQKPNSSSANSKKKCQSNGTPQKKQQSCGTPQKKDQSNGTPQKNKENNTAKPKRRSTEVYVPTFRSGPYAFLITLLSHESHTDFAGYLTKAEMLREAQPLCDASLTKPIPGSRYTAWSSMTSVVNKGLISRTGNPARFSLTQEGREMAVKLLRANQSNENASTSDPVSSGDRGIHPASFSPAKTVTASQSSSRAVPQKRTQTKKVARRAESPPLSSQGSFKDTYVPFSMQPGTFTIFLLVDTSETSGNSTCNRTRAELEDLRVNFEVRRLTVGDFVWVARDNDTNRELLLPYIVERKRMDDLGSSIKDGRFHEQKFRLKQSGITNLIYLVENYGNNEHLGLPLASVQQAAVNTRVVDKFTVKYTNDHLHSMSYLAAMTKTLISLYKEKTLVSSRKSELADRILGPKADVAFLITYEELNKSSSKVRNFTIREMLIRQLLQLHGLSVEKAAAITDLYPTPKALMKAFENGGEDLLTNTPFGANNRKIGPLISKALHQLYTARSLT